MILASVPAPALILSLTAAAAYTWAALRGAHLQRSTARLWVLVAWLLHGAVLGCGLLFTETPYFGFASALSVTAWLVAAVYGVESQIFPQLQTRWAFCGLGALAVLLSVVFPGNALPETASAWLPLHLAFGVACYGLFGVAAMHGWYMNRAEARIRHAEDPHSGLPLLTLERLTFRFVAAGFALLTLTLLAGLLFGDRLYGHGHALRLDHKTVFSVLAWGTFAALLMGRAWLGWRGRQAVKVLYAGTGFLLLAYVGSRFVLEVLLGRAP